MTLKGLPHFAVGEVIKGFGRGSKQLGIPTANYAPEIVNALPKELGTGVYYGFAAVDNGPVYKMVMSVGWNPYFKNKQKSMETYIMHEFKDDFYGKTLRLVMLGYLRPEKDFGSLEELIRAINDDIAQADTELDRSEFAVFKNHDFFSGNKPAS